MITIHPLEMPCFLRDTENIFQRIWKTLATLATLAGGVTVKIYF